MVRIYSNKQIQKARIAGQIVGEALNLAKTLVNVGVKTKDIDEKIEKFILSKGASCSFKNYNGFPACSCISVNEEVIHGIPSSRVLKSGDIVSIDVGACIEGLNADAARTFFVGSVYEEVKKLVNVTEESFYAGIKNAVVGNRICDISKSIFVKASKNGYDVVRSFCGHGVGENIHEEPQVPNYIMKEKGIRLEKGMILAVEPMVTIGSGEVEILKDNWTVVTKDKKLSAHYENTILITDAQPEILTFVEEN